MQVFPNGYGHFFADARHLRQILYACLLQTFHAAEMQKQLFPPFLTNSRNPGERGANGLPGSEFGVIFDSEAVGLVPDSGEKQQGCGVLSQNHGIFSSRQEDSFVASSDSGTARFTFNPAFGKGGCVGSRDAKVAQYSYQNIQLPRAAIDEDEIRRVYLQIYCRQTGGKAPRASSRSHLPG